MKTKLLLVILIVFSIFAGCENSFQIERNDFEDPEQLVSDVAGDISDASETIAKNAEVIGDVATFVSNRYSSVNRDIEKELLELGHTTDDLKYHYSGVIYRSYNWEADDIVEVEFDQDGQLVYIQYKDGTSARYENGELVWEYDGETSKNYDSQGRLTYIYYVDTEYWEAYRYYENGNLLRKETSLGYTYNYNEDGNLTSLESKYSIIHYNLDGQIVKYESKSSDYWYIYKYNDQGKRYYYEDSNGNWNKYTYNSNNQVTKYENSNGYWYIQEYNDQGRITYYETSNGYWTKQEYNNDGKLTYYENSEEYWIKYEYNTNGQQTYYENSNGYWAKSIYNDNKQIIYRATSSGYEWYDQTLCPNKECVEDDNSENESQSREIALAEGETTTFTMNGNTYNFSLLNVTSDIEALVKLNGQVFSTEIYNIEANNEIYVTLKDAFFSSVSTRKAYAKFIFTDYYLDMSDEEDFECIQGRDNNEVETTIGLNDAKDDIVYYKNYCAGDTRHAWGCNEDNTIYKTSMNCPNGCNNGECIELPLECEAPTGLTQLTLYEDSTLNYNGNTFELMAINSYANEALIEVNNDVETIDRCGSESAGNLIIYPIEITNTDNNKSVVLAFKADESSCDTSSQSLSIERLQSNGSVYVKSTYCEDIRITNSTVTLNSTGMCINYDAVLNKQDVTRIDFDCSTALNTGTAYDVIVRSTDGVYTSKQIAR